MRRAVLLLLFLLSSPVFADVVTVTASGSPYSATVVSLSCADVKSGFSATGITVNSCSSSPLAVGGYVVALIGGSWVYATVTSIGSTGGGGGGGATAADSSFWTQTASVQVLVFIGLVICFGLGYVGGRLR